MSLTLITGPVNSGKTSYLLQKVRDAQKPANIFYVTPNESTASELTRLYLTPDGESKNPPGILGTVFVSLNSFIREISGQKSTTLPSQNEALICFKLMQSQTFKYFNRGRLSFGIAKEAARTISQLKKNLITPSKLRQMLKTRGSLKEYDLVNLYDEYETAIRKLELFDRADLGSLAIKNIQDGRWPPRQTEAVIFDEFFLPEPLFSRLIAEIRRARPDLPIFVSLPAPDHKSQLFASWAIRSVDEFKALADEHVKMNSSRPSEATVSVLKLRSPLEEARFLAAHLAGEPGDEPVETVLCVKNAHPGTLLLKNELWEMDRDAVFPRQTHEFNTPAAAAFLSEAFIERLPKSAPILKMASVAEAALREMKADESWAGHLKSTPDRMHAARSFSSIVALDDLIYGIASADRLLDLGIISKNAFLEIVNESLEENRNFQFSIPSLGARISEFSSGIAAAVPRLFVPFAVEGAYPAPFADRLFFDEADELAPEPNKLLDDIFPRPDRLLAREAFLFHSWLCKTSREAIFTHSETDESGGENVRSSFLDPFGPSVPVDAPLRFPAAATSQDFKQFVIKRVAVEKERAQGKSTTPEYHAVITSSQAKDLIRRRYLKAKFSASSLEKYAECPFEFFIEKTLGLKPKDDETKEIVPKDRGTIIHSILENFYRSHFALFKRAIRSEDAKGEIKKTISSLTLAAFKSHAGIIKASSPVLHPFEMHSIATAVEEIVIKELNDARELPSPLFPFLCEWIFGEEKTPPLKLSIKDDEPAFIEGRVDRIDVSEDMRHFAVVDYKTGKTINSVSSKIKNGTHVQLPIYVAAVKELLLKDAVPLGGFLLAVMTAEKKHGFLKKDYNESHYNLGKKMSSLMDEEKWEDAFTSAMAHAAGHVSNIRKGDFAVTQEGCARHCKWKDVCRKTNG